MAVVVALSLLLQWRATGALTSELGAYSDEPAHYVTGLMVRDYVPAMWRTSPMAFAEGFYARYPKVALGNWPPGFYMLEVPWLLAIGDSPRSALIFMAILAALAATLTARIAVDEGGLALVIGTAAVWLTRPLSLALGGSIMTEIPLALFTAIFILGWTAVLSRKREWGAVGLGVLGGWALLIKASAVTLLAVPLLMGRDALQRKEFRLLLAVILTAIAIGGPWTLAFNEQARAGWIYMQPTLAFTRPAVPFYLTALASSLGPILCLGLGAWLFHVIRTRRLCAIERACVVAAAGVYVLLCVVPAGMEMRHLLPATVPLTALAVRGARAMVASLDTARRMAALGLAGMLAVADGAWSGLPQRQIAGYDAGVAALVPRCAERCVVLIVSDPEGEGAFIAEAARRRDSVPMTVVRGSKTLSMSDWAGRNYRALVTSPAQARAMLDRERIDIVVVDESAADRRDLDVARSARLVAGFPLAGTTPVWRHVVHPGRRVERRGVLLSYTAPHGS